MSRKKQLRGADVYVTVGEVERAQDAAQLMACAIAFDRAGRPVPASMLRRLWGLRREWRGRDDVPAQVLVACQQLDRATQRERGDSEPQGARVERFRQQMRQGRPWGE